MDEVMFKRWILHIISLSHTACTINREIATLVRLDETCESFRLKKESVEKAIASFSLVDKFLPDSVDVLDGIADLSTHLLLIALHLSGTERRSLESGHRG